MHPTFHKTLVEMRDKCARPGTICASFAFSGVPSMSESHMCVDLILDPYG